MRDLNFTLGADPEFTLVRSRDRAHISANDLVAIMGTSFPSVSMGVQMKGGVFGHDGHASTAELRPNPGATPNEITRNLGALIRELEFLTASRAQAITDSSIEQVGGHVHISVPRDVPASVVNAINWTLFLCAPLLRMTSEITRRHRTEYGRLDDVRYDMHSGTRTAELRFLPAEWLTTPQTTEAVFSYIACVYYEALNNQERVAAAYLPYLRGKIEDFNFKVLQSLESDMPSLFEMLVTKIRRDIRGFACYEQYKRHIQFALQSKDIKKRHGVANYDVFSGWCKVRTPPGDAPPRVQPTKEQFVSLRRPGEVTLQDSIASFIENYGQYSHMFNNSGGRDMRDLERALRTRVECTGLTVNTPVYLYGFSSDVDSDQFTSFKDGKINHPTRYSYLLKDAAMDGYAVIGIPVYFRNPGRIEDSKVKLADYFFMMQTNQLLYK